ncbi:hypothetical protein FSOLCH5_012681 [Fusarium solani]|nr:hypothetical protein NW759_006210 [Fusarium solani]
MTMSMHGTVCSGFDSKIPATQPEKQQYYTTRPLFRAMAIAIQGKDYSRCYDIRHLSYMPVLIILTGRDDGLSAPITFDKITDAEIITICGKVAARTNLETAIGFVTALEERENAAFGPQPDPVASTANSCYIFRENRAEQLGWDNEPLERLSSQWVDMNQYPTWTGLGARYDRILNIIGRRPFERHLEWDCDCIEQDLRNQ